MSKKASKNTNRTATFKKKWLPVIAGLGSMLAILALFNSQMIASSYIGLTYKPVDSSTQDVAVANYEIDEDAPAKILINNIEVDAPVDFNQQEINETSFQESLRNGVVHYPFTAKPGETGNSVIFGHSSGQVWAPGNYKFIFSKLEHLEPGNKIFVDYMGVRYEYEINGKKVVPPTDVSVLRPTSDNILTLITCYPVGSNAKRLIVTAKQINPIPKQAEPENTSEQAKMPSSNLPGNSRSTWQTIKSIFN